MGSTVSTPADPVEAAQRAEQLRSLVRYHQHRYYALDDPEVSDQEFDALFNELRSLEAAYPELRTADSPTQRVGGYVADRFEKTRHPAPMLSLANAFSPEELLQRTTGEGLTPQPYLAYLREKYDELYPV